MGPEAELLSPRFGSSSQEWILHVPVTCLPLVLSFLKHSVIQTKPNCLEVIVLSLLIGRCPVGMIRQVNARVEK